MTKASTGWFLASVLFMWFFVVASNSVFDGLRRSHGSRTVKRGWSLIWVGGVFVLAQAAWLYPLTLQHDIGAAFFIWLCVHGIIAFGVGERVLRMFRLVRDSSRG